MRNRSIQSFKTYLEVSFRNHGLVFLGTFIPLDYPFLSHLKIVIFINFPMKTFVFYGIFFKPMPLGYNLKSVTSEPTSTFVESIIPGIPILTILTFSKPLNGSISLMFGRHYNNFSCPISGGHISKELSFLQDLLPTT